MSDDEKDYRTTEMQAVKCDLLAINAATCHEEKHVLLTFRMNPNSFQVTEILIPLSPEKNLVNQLECPVTELMISGSLIGDINLIKNQYAAGVAPRLVAIVRTFLSD